ncbi:MAG: glycosyltransferase [Acidimicrobiales bacterium]
MSTPVNASLQSTTVIVAVGTDHHPFDRMISWIDSWSAANPEITVLVQRGTSASTRVCESVELLPHPDLCERFARAVAVVSHGGPSTVMDARMAGRMPIVMARDPKYGEHVDDHQMRFAEHLKRHDLAAVVDEEAALHAALDSALANPDDFSVPVDGAAITGVVEFGRVMDQLLGTTTSLTPSSPAGVAEDLPVADRVTVDRPAADRASADAAPVAAGKSITDLPDTAANEDVDQLTNPLGGTR